MRWLYLRGKRYQPSEGKPGHRLQPMDLAILVEALAGRIVDRGAAEVDGSEHRKALERRDIGDAGSGEVQQLQGLQALERSQIRHIRPVEMQLLEVAETLERPEVFDLCAAQIQ